MKNLIWSAIFALVAIGCKRGDIVIDNPVYDIVSDNTIDISSVEVTDSATTLTIDARYIPNYWIKMVSTSTLEADGKSYKLIGAEGIEPDSLFWMPESGQASFKLIFEPLPKSAREFNFIEGNEQGAFQIIGVDLTGKKSHADKIGAVPDDLLNASTEGTLPKVELENGEVDVNLHFFPYSDNLNSEMTVYINHIFDSQQEINLTVDSIGNASFKTDITGIPTTAYIAVGNSSVGQFTIDPSDKSMDVYVDLRKLAIDNMENHRDSIPRRNPDGYLFSTGKYGTADNLASREKISPAWNEIIGSPIYRMNGDEYVDMLMDLYNKSTAENESSDFPAMYKEKRQLYNMASLANYILNAPQYSRQSYMLRNGWGNPIPVDSIKLKIEQRHIEELGKIVDFSNPQLLLYPNILHNDLIIKDLIIKELPISDEFKALIQISQSFDIAQSGKITDEEIASAASKAGSKADYVAESLKRIRQKTLDSENGAPIKPLNAPDVPLDKLFKAIVEPYKGKVVIVDFWNTWCGPCRAAIRQNEPMKDSELADDDLVFVYIANESSPLPTYLGMISKIKGIHYRLDDKQWAQLTSKDFDIDGIPSYVLVERDGSYKLRNDFRDHSLYVSTIKDALKK